MGRRRKFNRRRGDNRVETKTDYGLIQNAANILEAPHQDGFDDLNASLEIPEFDSDLAPIEHSDISQDTSPPIAPTRKDNPHVFALVGATGGVGTTSLATQLAFEFATAGANKTISRSRPTDPTVCLIDLDFEMGACAHHLDLLPSLALEDLCGPADHIDTAFTQALMSTHASGVSLLAAPNTIGANARINPHTIMAMLDAAVELYDTVIIDLPRYQQPWTRPIMRAVDVLGLTCELTVPSLHAAQERLVQLSETANGAVNTQVILNKYERRSFKNMLRLSDAETALGRSVLSTLCLDPDTTREALNCGEPAGAIRPDSRFVKDVRKLSNLLRSQDENRLAKVA